MNNVREPIIIIIEHGGVPSVITTYQNEYRNLMALISDKIYLECFGECKGMGRCGTCLVEIIQSDEQLTNIERNEQATISKLGINTPGLRLACQVLIENALNGCTVRIAEAAG